MNNCSCCLGSYDGYVINKESELFHSWCEIPNRSKDNKVIESKGLCGFCNPKSTVWFTPSLTCHNKNAVPFDQPCPQHDFVDYLKTPSCRNCNAIKDVVNFWKIKGKNYRGNNFLEEIKLNTNREFSNI